MTSYSLEKNILGLVKEMHYMTPITYWYGVVLIKEVSSSRVGDLDVNSGVEKSLPPLILVFSNKWQIYFCCDESNLILVMVVTMPKKQFNLPGFYRKYEIDLKKWEELL